MAGTCTHGYAPGTCLICQTLGGGANPTVGSPTVTRPTVTRPTVSRPKVSGRRSPAMVPGGPRVVPPEAPRLRSSLGVRVIGAVVAVVVIMFLAWTALHVVFAVLHILELIGVALLAGYLGWMAGVYHGRRTPRR